MEGQRLLEQLRQVIPKNALKKLLKDESMDGDRALRLAHKVDDILRIRKDKHGSTKAKNKKTTLASKLTSGKGEQNSTKKSVKKLASSKTQGKSKSSPKNVTAEDNQEHA
jgi:hypothetical protein